MPVPIHPDDPLARCRFCPSIFLARTPSDKAFIADHEAACTENPERIFADSSRNWRGTNTDASSTFTVTQTVSSAAAPPVGNHSDWTF